MALPKTLHGLDVYVGGIDYIGVAASFTPPDIVAEVEESNMPGQGGPIDIGTGRLEKLTATFTMADSFPALETLVGRPSATDTEVLFLKVSTDGVLHRTVEYSLTGLWTSQSMGEVAGGGGAGAGGGGRCEYTVSVRTLTHRIDGNEQRFIDLERNIHRIGGQDVNAELSRLLRRGRRGGGAFDGFVV